MWIFLLKQKAFSIHATKIFIVSRQVFFPNKERKNFILYGRREAYAFSVLYSRRSRTLQLEGPVSVVDQSSISAVYLVLSSAFSQPDGFVVKY